MTLRASAIKLPAFIFIFICLARRAPYITRKESEP